MERRTEEAWREFKERKSAEVAANPVTVDDLDRRGLMQLVRGRDLALSEWELFRLAVRWCRRRNGPWARAGLQVQEDLADWAMHIDFGAFTPEQRLLALHEGVPRRLVYNALGQSALLAERDLAAFKLDDDAERMHWKLLAEGTMEHPLAFNHFYTALTGYKRKLLVMQMAEPSQVIVMYLQEAFPGPGTYECGEDMLVFAFAGSLRRKQPLPSHNLWLDLTSNRLQIYRNGNVSNSFLWLHKGRPPVVPGAPVALTAPLAEMQPNVSTVEGSGSGSGSRAAGRDRRDAHDGWRRWGGRAAGGSHQGGRGRGRGSTGSGSDGYVRVSIATIELDRQAWLDGQLRKVAKEPLLRYELYVASDSQPLLPRGTWHLGGTQPATDEDPGANAPMLEEVAGGCALPPPEVGASYEDLMQLRNMEARACNGGAVEAHAAQLAVRLARQDKLRAAMRAARLARHVLDGEQLEDLLRCAARLHAWEEAPRMVEWMLALQQQARPDAPAGPSTPGEPSSFHQHTMLRARSKISRAAEVLSMAARCGVLATCPELVVCVWDRMQQAAAETASTDASAAPATSVGSASVGTLDGRVSSASATGSGSANASDNGRSGASPSVPTADARPKSSDGPFTVLRPRDMELLLRGAIGCGRRQPEVMAGLLHDMLATLAPLTQTHGSVELVIQLMQECVLAGLEPGAAEAVCETLLSSCMSQSHDVLLTSASQHVRGGAADAGSCSGDAGGASGWAEGVRRYCLHFAAALTCEALAQALEAEQALEDRAASAATGPVAHGSGSNKSSFPDIRQPLLWDHIAGAVMGSTRTSGASKGSDTRSGIASGSGASSLQQLAAIHVREQAAAAAAAARRRVGAHPEALAGSGQVLELRNLIVAAPHDTRPQPPDNAAAVPEDALADWPALGAADDAGRSESLPTAADVGTSSSGGAGASTPQDYDESMGTSTAEGHDAYGSGPIRSGDGAVSGPSCDGGAFVLELCRRDGIPFTAGSSATPGLRVGDLVRLSDMRTPHHRLHAGAITTSAASITSTSATTTDTSRAASVASASGSGSAPALHNGQLRAAASSPIYIPSSSAPATAAGVDGNSGGGLHRAGLPLVVQGLVTEVGASTIKVKLPWRPYDYSNPGAVAPAGDGAGSIAAAAAGQDDAPRLWRLQQLGNVIPYERGMQALLRVHKWCSPSSQTLPLLTEHQTYSPLGVIVGSWAGQSPPTVKPNGGAQPLAEERAPASIVTPQPPPPDSSSRSPSAAEPARGKRQGADAGPSGAQASGSRQVSDADWGWSALAASRVISVSSAAVQAACDAAGSNASQRAAVQAAAERRLTIIHGPPGTGKTTTIAALLVALLRDEVGTAADRACGAPHHSGPILVAAETNVAVDNIMDRMLKLLSAAEAGGGSTGARGSAGVRGGGGGDGQPRDGPPGCKGAAVVRVGDSASVSTHLREHCLELIKGARTEYGYNSRFVRQVLRKARVVFATCAGCGSPLLDGVDFGFVVVDEASQATEPTTLIPLTRGCRQAVLVGDHRQLGPLVRSQQQRLSLELPLFERLQQRERVRLSNQAGPGGCSAAGGDGKGALAAPATSAPAVKPKDEGSSGCSGRSSSGSGPAGNGGVGGGAGLRSHMLDIQYRMHPDIAQFPAGYLYGGRLRNGENTPGIPLPAPLTQRVTFKDVPDSWEQRRGGHSIENTGQAQAAVMLVEELIRRNPSGSSRPLTAVDIGIITPYRATADLIKSRLGRHYSAVEVSTVDGFQGREKRVILLVTVRANRLGKLGFVDDPRRLNVAITRAQAALVVVGHKDTLEKAARKVVATAGRNGREEGAVEAGSGPGRGGLMVAWLRSLGVVSESVSTAGAQA